MCQREPQRHSEEKRRAATYLSELSDFKNLGRSDLEERFLPSKIKDVTMVMNQGQGGSHVNSRVHTCWRASRVGEAKTSLGEPRRDAWPNPDFILGLDSKFTIT